MESQGQKQSHRAGEVRGQAQMMGDRDRNTTQEAKDKASQTAQQAKEKTQSATYQAKDKASQTAQQGKEKTQSATYQVKDKAAQAAEKARETGQAGQEKTSGILQQTGETMKSMAKGAADAVKSTIGMGKKNDEPDTGVYHHKETTATNTGTTAGAPGTKNVLPRE